MFGSGEILLLASNGRPTYLSGGASGTSCHKSTGRNGIVSSDGDVGMNNSIAHQLACLRQRGDLRVVLF